MAGKKDWWDKGQVIAVAAIPVVLGFIGHAWQQAALKQQLAKEYVQIAVSILSTRPISQDDPLRPWAVEVINRHSTVPLSLPQRRALQMGEYMHGPAKGAEPIMEQLPGR